jgi:hypothetical protein
MMGYPYNRNNSRGEMKLARTRRKPYTKSKRFDRTCRNHGSCGYCRNNRTYFDRKWRAAADEELKMSSRVVRERRSDETGHYFFVNKHYHDKPQDDDRLTVGCYHCGTEMEPYEEQVYVWAVEKHGSKQIFVCAKCDAHWREDYTKTIKERRSGKV